MRKRLSVIKSKKGISIVEVVISMTLLVIIVSTTLSVAFSSATITNNAYSRFEAVNQIADIMELYKYSSNDEEFNQIISEIYPNEYTMERNGSLTFVIKDTSINILTMNNAFYGYAYFTKNERQIYSCSYSKGGI